MQDYAEQDYSAVQFAKVNAGGILGNSKPLQIRNVSSAIERLNDITSRVSNALGQLEETLDRYLGREANVMQERTAVDRAEPSSTLDHLFMNLSELDRQIVRLNYCVNRATNL